MVARTLRHEVGDLLQTIYSAIAILRSRLPDEAAAERRLLTELHTQAETCKYKLDAIQDLTLSFDVDAGRRSISPTWRPAWPRASARASRRCS